MAKKKRRGRPIGAGRGAGVQIGGRWPVDLMKRIDAWRAKQPGGLTRAQAIRWLTQQGLKVSK